MNRKYITHPANIDTSGQDKQVNKKDHKSASMAHTTPSTQQVSNYHWLTSADYNKKNKEWIRIGQNTEEDDIGI